MMVFNESGALVGVVNATGSEARGRVNGGRVEPVNAGPVYVPMDLLESVFDALARRAEMVRVAGGAR